MFLYRALVERWCEKCVPVYHLCASKKIRVYAILDIFGPRNGGGGVPFRGPLMEQKPGIVTPYGGGTIQELLKVGSRNTNDRQVL